MYIMKYIILMVRLFLRTQCRTMQGHLHSEKISYWTKTHTKSYSSPRKKKDKFQRTKFFSGVIQFEQSSVLMYLYLVLWELVQVSLKTTALHSMNIAFSPPIYFNINFSEGLQLDGISLVKSQTSAKQKYSYTFCFITEWLHEMKIFCVAVVLLSFLQQD